MATPGPGGPPSRAGRPGAPGAPAAIVPAVAALVALAVYVWTLNPTVPAGDSGELITAARIGGVAHPPGYPLYTMLGWIWTRVLPWGAVAWRMNLLSALAAAAAVGVLARVTLRLTGSAAAALVAAFTLAFAPPFWKNAVVAEVFTLNALLATLVLAALARVLDDARHAAGARPARPLAALAFLSTLLLSHHHTLVLLAAPALLAAVLLVTLPGRVLARAGLGRPYRIGARAGLAIGASALAGLAPLLYLPLASRAHPALDWGDPETPRALLRLLLRVDYGTFRLDPIAAGNVADRSHVLLYLQSLPRDLGPAGIVLLVLGIWALARRRPVLGATLGAFAILQAIFLTRVQFPTQPVVLRGVVERFYVMPDVVAALVAGLGAALVLAWLRPSGRRIAAPLLVALAAAWPLVAHARAVTQRGDTFTGDICRDILASLPRGAVLFNQGDLFHNGLAYLQNVEGMRPDVAVADQELMTYDWYVRALRRAHPDLLPPLGGGERIHLRDGRTLEGRILDRPAGRLGVLVPGRWMELDTTEVASIEWHPDPAGLFAGAQKDFRWSALSPPATDRYSGMPGTVNVLWLDHLRGRRPVCFLGLKDETWALRYEMIPEGFVLHAYPKGEAPAMGARVAGAVAMLGRAHLDDYFRDYDPWSFEAEHRWRIAEFATRAALLLSQHEAAAFDPATNPGVARLGAFVARFERLDPSPEPLLLRAAGMLRIHNPHLRDMARGREDLERYLATGARGPEAEEAKRTLTGLGR